MRGLRAAVTLGLTGRYAVQARQARSGLELWAGDDHVDLHIHDDTGSSAVAAAAYREFLAGDFDILLSPYGSGLVRRAAATVCGSHRLLWNHGAQRMISPVPDSSAPRRPPRRIFVRC
jgi:hypothetical protein